MSHLPILGLWLRRFFTEHLSSERNLAINTQKSYRDSFMLLLPYLSDNARKPVERLSIQDITSNASLGSSIILKPSGTARYRLATNACRRFGPSPALSAVGNPPVSNGRAGFVRLPPKKPPRHRCRG